MGFVAGVSILGVSICLTRFPHRPNGDQCFVPDVETLIDFDTRRAICGGKIEDGGL